jgi:rhodanese-related sulfurtransferase
MQQFVEFVTNHYILWSLFVVLSGMLAWSFFVGLTAGIKQLNPTEFTRMINQDRAVMVDVREAAAFKKGHILGARHIPLAELDRRADELKIKRDGPTLVYCQTGSTSLRAGKDLKNKGFEQVYALKGGVLAWLDAKLPLTTD